MTLARVLPRVVYLLAALTFAAGIGWGCACQTTESETACQQGSE